MDVLHEYFDHALGGLATEVAEAVHHTTGTLRVAQGFAWTDILLWC